MKAGESRDTGHAAVGRRVERAAESFLDFLFGKLSVAEDKRWRQRSRPRRPVSGHRIERDAARCRGVDDWSCFFRSYRTFSSVQHTGYKQPGHAMMTIRSCRDTDFDDVCIVCNDGAAAYRDAIPLDRWKDPYMPADELRREIDEGVRFFGAFDEQGLAGVMGLQDVGDVALIRHAYTRTHRQRAGIGGALLRHLQSLTDRPILVGTWKAATWAVRFYEHHGFTLVDDPDRETLLRRYWSIPDRQIDESVVLREAASRGRSEEANNYGRDIDA
jgi:GNAT superfamily N-acetyltransferase